MKFKNLKHPGKQTPPFPGQTMMLQGRAAIELLNGALEKGIHSNIGKQMEDAAALAGCRVDVVVDSRTAREGLMRLPGFPLLPIVYHIANDMLPSVEIPGFHTDGILRLYAKNVQEMIDFSLIAHRVAEACLLPVICIYDRWETGNALQSVNFPEADFIREFLGAPDDLIDSPTPAQILLFGEQRERVVNWLNLDKPVISGVHLTAGQSFNAAVYQSAYFRRHISQFLDSAISEFAQLTDRLYEPVAAKKPGSADYLVVAQGALVNYLEILATVFQKEKKAKISVINPRVSSPFPGAAISHLLKGSQALIVFEPDVTAQNAPASLMTGIRTSIDKSLENGAARKGRLPYPAHAVYGKLNDRPQLFKAILNPESQLPEINDLAGALENILPGGAGKRQFYMGITRSRVPEGFPKLEISQQFLEKHYPDASDLTPTGSGLFKQWKRNAERGSLVLKLLSFEGDALQTGGSILAKTLARALSLTVNAFHSPQESTFHPAIYTISLSPAGSPPLPAIASTDVLLAAEPSLLRDLTDLRTGGTLILLSDLKETLFWAEFTETVRRQIRNNDIRLFRVGPAPSCSETILQQGYFTTGEHLQLIGACIGARVQNKDDQNAAIETAYKEIEATWAARPQLVESLKQNLQSGAASVKQINYRDFPTFRRLPAKELEAPLSVQVTEKSGNSVWDPARFWHSVAYFYETGHPQTTRMDPHFASSVVPAATAGMQDMTAFRDKMPRLLPEACNGCGLCFAQCPDAALPAVIQTPAALIEFAVKLCQKEGQELTQFPRIMNHLTKQATAILLRDQLKQYTTLGELLKAAFSQLMTRLTTPPGQSEALAAELDTMYQLTAGFPIIRTETFFEKPEKANAGNGKVLSIALNPQACKGCMLCEAVCPENAWEEMPQTDDIVKQYRHNWQFLMNLPETPSSELNLFISPEIPRTHLYHLLNKRVYHTMHGGDAASPGSGTKTALHLITAAAQAVMQPGLESFMERVNSARKRLEEKIQSHLVKAVEVNDFEEFSRRLSKLESSEDTSDDLMALFAKETSSRKTVKQIIQPLNSALKDLRQLQTLYQKRIQAGNQVSMIMILNHDQIAAASAAYPYTAFAFPVVNVKSGNMAALAVSTYKSAAKKIAAEVKTIRKAELLADDLYDREIHDAFFQQFSAADFEEHEKRLCPPVLAVCSTSGFHLNRRKFINRLSSEIPVKIVVINDDDQTAGELPLLEFSDWFVLQSGTGHPEHLFAGALEGLQFTGSTLLHIYAGDPQRHRIPANTCASQSRMAVKSRFFPLFRYSPPEGDTLAERLLIDDNPNFEDDWTTADNDATGPDNQDPLPAFTVADWAIREGRFREEFQPLSKRDWDGNLCPLAAYLDLEMDARSEHRPYILLRNTEDQPVRVLVSPKMVNLCETTLKRWRGLQELAGVDEPGRMKLTLAVKSEVEKDLNREKDQLTETYESQIRALDQQHWQIYHERVTRRLRALCGFEAADGFSRQLLKNFLTEKDSQQ